MEHAIVMLVDTERDFPLPGSNKSKIKTTHAVLVYREEADDWKARFSSYPIVTNVRTKRIRGAKELDRYLSRS
jgi:hypothetical protein